MTEAEEIEELRKLRDYWKRAAENAHRHLEDLEEENDALRSKLDRIREVKRYSLHVVSEFGYAPELFRRRLPMVITCVGMILQGRKRQGYEQAN